MIPVAFAIQLVVPDHKQIVVVGLGRSAAVEIVVTSRMMLV